MERKTIIQLYFGFLIIIALALLTVSYLDRNYKQTDLVDLKESYNIDESKGEKLISCDGGTYEVYKPQEQQISICGTFLTDEVITYLNNY